MRLNTCFGPEYFLRQSGCAASVLLSVLNKTGETVFSAPDGLPLASVFHPLTASGGNALTVACKILRPALRRR